ncbi:MAG TPA: aquaporin [Verrucomicrobiae bacterium]|nr:aquaporin [Verrucomicrobiae bacterium]
MANTIATGAVLMCLIAALGPISGAHFNPAVSLADAMRGGLRWSELPLYIAAQIAGAIAGVAAANTMFGLPLFFASHRARSGPAQWFAEFIATFGLLLVIWGCVRFKSAFVPFAVGSYIVAAYWFTSSTSFANPAVTIARTLSDTFAGIRPQDAPGFIVAQLVGAICATLLFRWIDEESYALA